jgi:hypothetical protein
MTRRAQFVSLIGMGKSVCLLAVSAGLCACGDSSSGGDKEDDEKGTLPGCAAECPEILAAKCSHGPVSQADCVGGCEAVRASACTAENEALYACGGAKPRYVCSAAGQVSLSGCDKEGAALYSCLARQ